MQDNISATTCSKQELMFLFVEEKDIFVWLFRHCGLEVHGVKGQTCAHYPLAKLFVSVLQFNTNSLSFI